MHSKQLIILSLSFLLVFSSPLIAEAHPGRTDSSGGHTCRTNCESWGLGYGEYHYHGGGYEAPAYEEQYVAPEQEEYIAPTKEIITEQIIEEAEAEPITESVTTEPSAESENSSNNSDGSLLGLAALGGLGYLGWRKLKGKKKEDNPEA